MEEKMIKVHLGCAYGDDKKTGFRFTNGNPNVQPAIEPVQFYLLGQYTVAQFLRWIYAKNARLLASDKVLLNTAIFLMDYPTMLIKVSRFNEIVTRLMYDQKKFSVLYHEFYQNQQAMG